jgi:hypothetical protein
VINPDGVSEGLVLVDVGGDPPPGALGKAIRITPAAFEIWPMCL